MKATALRDWYATLAPRDQRILRFGAVGAVVIVLLWVLLPLQRNLSTARTHLQQQQQDVEWMRQVGPTLAAAGPGAASISKESLVVVIDTTARESGLAQALTGSQPTGNGAMRITLEGADFNLLLGWLSRLSSQQGVRVEAANITGTDAAGLVNASVQLRPAT
jgi:type II secretory pathway component PulM